MHHDIGRGRRHCCRRGFGVWDFDAEVGDELIREARPFELAALGRVEGKTGHPVPAAEQEQRKPRPFETGVTGDQVVHGYRAASAMYSWIESATKSSIGLVRPG